MGEAVHPFGEAALVGKFVGGVFQELLQGLFLDDVAALVVCHCLQFEGEVH